MGRAVLLLLALSGGASVPAGTRPMTVGEVVQRQDELDGQSIRVEAIMGGCNLSGCELRDAGGGSSSILAGGDAAYANAGRGLSKPGTEAGDLDDIRGMIDLNVMGVVLTARALLPHLRKTRGTLVLTGSAAGRQHIKGSIYGATKWFVHGYAGNLAEEMREWGGRCCVVAPGMVDTAFFDDGAPDKLQPDDVAAAVMQMITAPDRAAIREVYLMPQA